MTRRLVFWRHTWYGQRVRNIPYRVSPSAIIFTICDTNTNLENRQSYEDVYLAARKSNQTRAGVDIPQVIADNCFTRLCFDDPVLGLVVVDTRSSHEQFFHCAQIRRCYSLFSTTAAIRCSCFASSASAFYSGDVHVVGSTWCVLYYVCSMDSYVITTALDLVYPWAISPLSPRT